MISFRRQLRSVAVVITLAAALLSACAGPRNSIDVSVREVPSDVLLGTPAVPNTIVPTMKSDPSPLGFPPFIQPPPPLGPRPPLAARALAACPVADRDTAPRLLAPKTGLRPPLKQTIEYRNTGRYSFRQRGGPARTGTFPAISARRVDPGPVASDGTFSFVVTETVGSDETATTYFVDPDAGLYLAGVSQRSEGRTDVFMPADRASIPLLPLPAKQGTTLTGFGVDPLNATVMRTSGTVMGKTTVDACGTRLDAWDVRITDGTVTSPGRQFSFTASYAIGTQYGGLSLRDAVDVKCDPTLGVVCENTNEIVSSNVATVTSSPVAPEGA